MSLSSTLNNALTGLAASSRAAQLVSTNVSNSLTEGYARREIELSPKIVGNGGSGVQVDGITRVVDETLLRERRLSAASIGAASVEAEFLTSALELVGQPEQDGSLNARVASFETALLEAASRPDSDARLASVLNTAQSLADKLNRVSDGIQILRQDADVAIDLEIRRLNQALTQIDELNGQILRAQGNDRDYPALLDNQQRLVDEISELVPIRQLQRENDTIALYSLNGALLLDIEPAEFGFSATSPITADMTQASGALSGLSVNGNPVATSGENGAIAGGRLAGLFAIRDELAVSVQENVDTITRDLIARFEDPGLDATLAAGDPGLFTDNGTSLNPLDTVGLGARLSVNSLVNPLDGGALWRLRSGLGAATPGASGDPVLLQNMGTRMSDVFAPAGGTFSPSAKSASSFAAELTSLLGQSFQSGNNRLTFEQSRFAGLDEAFLAQGVDTDQELQKLLLIERSYAANARVIQTADELIQLLIGL